MVRRLATRTALLAAVLLAGLTVPRLAAAQPHGGGPQGDAAGLDMFLGAVVRDWQQAWEMNRQTNSPEVRSHLTHAKSLLDEARMERDRGNLPRAWALAESGAAFVRRANEMLRLRDRQGAPQQTEQALREAEEMLDRLRRLGPMGPRTGEVDRLIEQARKATAEGHSQVALRCALMAQDQGRRGWQESMHARMAAQRSRVLETVVEPLVEQAMRLAQERKDERMTAVASRAQEHLYMARQMDTETQGGPKARLLESAMREAELVLRTLDEAGYARHRSERLAQRAYDLDQGK